VLHGVPAADFSSDELLYLPRNVRSHRLYGMSPVEQIALTINIALRRDAATLDYYRSGSVPDSFATLPKEWTVDQIRQFQDYFDALMSGNLARRRMVKFIPADFKLTETRQPPLKDSYDEWLARVICYAFSVPASAFVSQVNRATSETLRMQATKRGSRR
jgi:phage portal protein BeeE